MDDFAATHLDALPDFWRRRAAAAPQEHAGAVCGYPYRVAANHPDLLEAARLSDHRFSRGAPVAGGRPISLRYVLDRELPDTPVPADWPRRLRHQGAGRWLMVSAEPWVTAFADLDTWEGVARVSAPLMGAPYMLSRYIGDTFALNMLMRSGWGQLHASCLWRDGRAVLLAAPHNTGKSTPALRLSLRVGRVLSDGMTYGRAAGGGLELFGYPVGEIKLRFDMLGEFPQARAGGQAALVREDAKMIYDLRREMPERVVEESVRPREVALCLLERAADPGGAARTTAEPVDRETALRGVWPDSAHVDALPVLRSHYRSLRALLDGARCYRLRLGSDAAGIVAAVDRL